MLVTNEMPFGHWLAGADVYVDAAAIRSIMAHESGLKASTSLAAGAVLSSRPVRHEGRLLNQAVMIQSGRVTALGAKQVFPEEPGWRVETWFRAGPAQAAPAPIGTVRVGMLLCTEMMFTERARAWGRAGAGLIACPRATGPHEMWRVAGAMAAISAGAFVASSNRVGQASRNGPLFGGGGFIHAPGGGLLGVTTQDAPVFTATVDLAEAARAQTDYPCYVRERAFTAPSAWTQA